MTKTQSTVKKAVTLSGIALHTGNHATLTLQPAPPDFGIQFERTDLDGRPRIEARVENVVETQRGTTLGKGAIRIHTVEHVLSALAAFGVDNVRIEMDSNEPPVGDGSARPFAEMIQKAGVQAQPAQKEIFVITESLTLNNADSTTVVLPLNPEERGESGPILRISCTNADSQNRFVQFFSVDVTREAFEKQIAPARTFCFYDEVATLIKSGLIKGGSLETAIIIRDDAVLTKGPLRFPDEFVRHKILDIIGDLSLLGQPLAGHIIALKPGHAVNCLLVKALAARRDGRPTSVTIAASSEALGDSLNAEQIQKLLPHRYPFLLVDRILKIEGDKRVTGLKNVSFNEPFFQGHFPGHPIMPGVLQLEAMAQVGGVLVMKQGHNAGKLTYFMSIDKAKFRRPVVPGDQLIIECELLKARERTVKIRGVARVEGEVVSEAELMFAVMEKS